MYVQNSKEKLAVSVREKVPESVGTTEVFKARCKAENFTHWQDKPLYGEFARQNKDQRKDTMWMQTTKERNCMRP